jgi:hypothetical protein
MPSMSTNVTLGLMYICGIVLASIGGTTFPREPEYSAMGNTASSAQASIDAQRQAYYTLMVNSSGFKLCMAAVGVFVFAFIVHVRAIRADGDAALVVPVAATAPLQVKQGVSIPYDVL